MHIVVGPQSIENLFTGKRRVKVPNFQRNYAWTPVQISEFMDDVIESALDDTAHFWGPVVFLISEDDPDTFEIIDGQQRLTTAVIMISLLRDAAFGFADRLIYAGTPGEHNLYSKFRNILFLPPMFTEPRFTANYLVEKAFNTAVLPDPAAPGTGRRPALSPNGRGMSPAEKRNTKELRKNYNDLKKKLDAELAKFATDEEKKSFLDSIYRALTSNFEIHSMILDDVNDAYVLFETLNNRGLRLNPADLLKTLTLRNVQQTSGQKKFDEALELWDETTLVLVDYDFSKFLRHYLLTQTQQKIQTNKIYRSFADAIKELGSDGAWKNLRLLNKAANIYAELLGYYENSDTELQRTFARMNTYSDTHRVFLLGMMLLKLDRNTRRSLARAIEVLSFRWIAAGRNAQELETFYQRMVHELSRDTSSSNIDSVRKQILSMAPLDSELSGLHLKTSGDLQLYALRRIEEGLTRKSLDWYEKIHIETLAPKRPQDERYWADHIAPLETPDGNDDYEDFVLMWGNLTLMENRLLASVDREVWPTKVSGLAGPRQHGLAASKFALTVDVRKCSVWTRAHIEDRSQWIKASILSLASPQWAETGDAAISTWDRPKLPPQSG
jgi:hypothetical protein